MLTSQVDSQYVLPETLNTFQLPWHWDQVIAHLSSIRGLTADASSTTTASSSSPSPSTRSSARSCSTTPFTYGSARACCSCGWRTGRPTQRGRPSGWCGSQASKSCLWHERKRQVLGKRRDGQGGFFWGFGCGFGFCAYVCVLLFCAALFKARSHPCLLLMVTLR